MKILFIGNSHTYFNDMPHIFEEICRCNGIRTQTTMLAHGGRGLDFHVKEPEVLFNIRYGNYHAVVLQHSAHPMGDLKKMEQAALELSRRIDAAHSLPILYMTWTKQQDGAQAQPEMSRVYRKLGERIGCPVAPVGEVWWRYHQLFRSDQLYAPDGEHASALGSLLAAYTIAGTVTKALSLLSGPLALPEQLTAGLGCLNGERICQAGNFPIEK